MWCMCRANMQVMLFTVMVGGLALTNAMVVPLMLERQINSHPGTLPVQLAGR